MNKITIFCLSIFFIQSLSSSTQNLTIINQSSDQITVTLQTANQTVSKSALPNENHTVNTMNNSVLTGTILSYTASPIIKITIDRLSTNLPQIIYYNNEVTVDSRQQSTGIYSINRGISGTIIILQDSVLINNQSYNLMDLKSCIIKCNTLNQQLSSTNIDVIEQQTDDLAVSLKAMQGSDKNTEIESQLNVLQSQIDIVRNNIKIMKSLTNNIKKTKNLIDNLSNQNADQAKNAIQSLEIELQAFMQSHLQETLYQQAQVAQNNITKLKVALQQYGISFQATNYEFTIPYSQDQSTGYQQIDNRL